MTRKIEGSSTIGEDLLLTGLQGLAKVAKAAEAIWDEATACTREMVAAATGGLERLSRVGSFAEAVGKQAEAALQGYAALAAGTTRMSRLYAELGRQACMPFEGVIAKGR